jgi:MSHA pilin protein MshD
MSIKPMPMRQAGLTMIELIVFIVIVGVTVAGVMGALVNIQSRSVDPLQRKQAMLRAESLLEEVMLARFTYCHPDDANAETATSAAGCAAAELVGPVAGETRPYYNINDYVSAYGTATSFNPADTSGNIVTDVTGAVMSPSGYKAMVTIKTVPAFGPAGMQIVSAAPVGTSADAEVLHISVQVTYANNKSVVLDGYRTRYAPNSLP